MQDGSGDFASVQAAVDAVPANNAEPVGIFIRDGVYKEVSTTTTDPAPWTIENVLKGWNPKAE